MATVSEDPVEIPGLKAEHGRLYCQFCWREGCAGLICAVNASCGNLKTKDGGYFKASIIPEEIWRQGLHGTRDMDHGIIGKAVTLVKELEDEAENNAFKSRMVRQYGSFCHQKISEDVWEVEGYANYFCDEKMRQKYADFDDFSSAALLVARSLPHLSGCVDVLGVGAKVLMMIDEAYENHITSPSNAIWRDFHGFQRAVKQKVGAMDHSHHFEKVRFGLEPGQKLPEWSQACDEAGLAGIMRTPNFAVYASWFAFLYCKYPDWRMHWAIQDETGYEDYRLGWFNRDGITGKQILREIDSVMATSTGHPIAAQRSALSVLGKLWMRTKCSVEVSWLKSGPQKCGISVGQMSRREHILFSALDSIPMAMADMEFADLSLHDLAVTRLLNDIVDFGDDMTNGELGQMAHSMIDWSGGLEELGRLYERTCWAALDAWRNRRQDAGCISATGTIIWQMTNGRHKQMASALAGMHIPPKELDVWRSFSLFESLDEYGRLSHRVGPRVVQDECEVLGEIRANFIQKLVDRMVIQNDLPKWKVPSDALVPVPLSKNLGQCDSIGDENKGWILLNVCVFSWLITHNAISMNELLSWQPIVDQLLASSVISACKRLDYGPLAVELIVEMSKCVLLHYKIPYFAMVHSVVTCDLSGVGGGDKIENLSEGFLQS